MELQTAFYVIGIIFMSLMLLLTLAGVVAVFVIKAKINAIHRRVDEKLQLIVDIARVGSDIVDSAKRAVGK